MIRSFIECMFIALWEDEVGTASSASRGWGRLLRGSDVCDGLVVLGGEDRDRHHGAGTACAKGQRPLFGGKVHPRLW